MIVTRGLGSNALITRGYSFAGIIRNYRNEARWLIMGAADRFIICSGLKPVVCQTDRH